MIDPSTLDLKTRLLTTHNTFDNDTNGALVIGHHQEIPQWHTDALQGERFYNANHKATDYHRVCSVPVAIVEKWQREGYDIMTEPAAKTVARLKHESLDHFITSDKA